MPQGSVSPFPSTYRLTETEMERPRLDWISTISPAHMLWLWACCLCGKPDCRSRYMPDYFVCSWESFSLFGFPCPVSTWGFLPCFIILYLFLLLLFGSGFLEACSYLNRKHRWSGLGKTRKAWGKLGGMEKLWLGCIVLEKNLFSLFKIAY